MTGILFKKLTSHVVIPFAIRSFTKQVRMNDTLTKNISTSSDFFFRQVKKINK